MSDIIVQFGGDEKRQREITAQLKNEVRRRRALGETITPDVRKQIVDDVVRQYEADEKAQEPRK